MNVYEDEYLKELEMRANRLLQDSSDEEDALKRYTHGSLRSSDMKDSRNRMFGKEDSPATESRLSYVREE